MDEPNLRDKTKTLLSLQYELLGQEGKLLRCHPA